MRSLIIESPVVRNVFDVVFAAGRKFAHRLGCVAAKNFWKAACLVEILLEPFEDAGDFGPFLARQKLVEIPAREPCPKCMVVLLFQFIRRVGEALKGRTTARRA